MVAQAATRQELSEQKSLPPCIIEEAGIWTTGGTMDGIRQRASDSLWGRHEALKSHESHILKGIFRVVHSGEDMPHHHRTLEQVFMMIEGGERGSDACQNALRGVLISMKSTNSYQTTYQKALRELFWIEAREQVCHEVYLEAVNVVYIFLYKALEEEARSAYVHEITGNKGFAKDPESLTWGLSQHLFSHEEIEVLKQVQHIEGNVQHHYLAEHSIPKFHSYIDAARNEPEGHMTQVRRQIAEKNEIGRQAGKNPNEYLLH